MATYCINLPLPPAECSVNSNAGWRDKATKRKQYRTLCAILYQDYKNKGILPAKFQTPIKISLEFWYARSGQQFTTHYNRKGEVVRKAVFCFATDELNAAGSFKSGQDALQDAGMILSDSHKYVCNGETRIRSGDNNKEKKIGLVMTIEEVN